MCVTTEENFAKVLGKKIWGVEKSYKKAIESLKPGDELYFHITKASLGFTFIVASAAFFSEKPIWDDRLYPYRIEIKPKVIPLSRVSDRSILNHLHISPRQSMRKLTPEQFRILEEHLLL